MSVTQEQFAYIFEEVCKAEDPVRLENPEFVTGFHAISMQGHRLDFTINRLSDVKKNLKDSENIILVNMSKLRTANPDKEPKGTNWTKRMLKDKPLWQKVVSAHTIDDNNKENIDPNLSYGGDDDNLAMLSQTLKAMSAKDAKIEVENHDYTLRHKLEGIKKLCTLMDTYIDVLTPRLHKVERLEAIGKKWTECTFDINDLDRIGKAQQEITDGSFEVKAIIDVLDAFPKDFTKLCELEGVGRGIKRKIEWAEDVETPETIKKGCLEDARGLAIATRSKGGKRQTV